MIQLHRTSYQPLYTTIHHTLHIPLYYAYEALHIIPLIHYTVHYIIIYTFSFPLINVIKITKDLAFLIIINVIKITKAHNHVNQCASHNYIESAMAHHNTLYVAHHNISITAHYRYSILHITLSNHINQSKSVHISSYDIISTIAHHNTSCIA